LDSSKHPILEKKTFSTYRMSSVLASPSQVPSSTGYLLCQANATSADFVPDAPWTFTVGTGGVVSVTGSNVVFDTYANARTALNSATNSVALSAGDFFRDLGKTYNFFVQNTTAGMGPQLVAKFTKVSQLGAGGQTTEGVSGLTNTTYGVGWVCTWSANPTSGSGVGVAVTRVGA
jgi:hypothetical protein